MRLFQDRRTSVLSRDHRGDSNLALASRHVPNGEVYQLKLILHIVRAVHVISVSGPPQLSKTLPILSIPPPPPSLSL